MMMIDDLEDREKAEYTISCGFSVSSSRLCFPISQRDKQNLGILIIFRPVIVILQLKKLENANMKDTASLVLVNPKQRTGWNLWVQKGQVIFSAFNALLSTHCLQFTNRMPADGTLLWLPAPRTAHVQLSCSHFWVITGPLIKSNRGSQGLAGSWWRWETHLHHPPLSRERVPMHWQNNTFKSIWRHNTTLL